MEEKNNQKEDVVVKEKASDINTGLTRMPEEPQPVQKVPNVQNLWQLAEGLYKSGMFPQVKNAYGAMTIIEYGRELGIQPVMALQTMSVVNGTICIESKALLAQAMSKGIKVKIKEKTKEKSVIEFHRPGQESFTETFTIKDAQEIGLANKSNWRQYPEEMCYWRCVAKGLRAYAPDVLLGLYTIEEVKDFGTGGAFGEAEKEKVKVSKKEYQKEKKEPTKKKATKKTTKKQTQPKEDEEPNQTSTDEKEKIAEDIKKVIVQRYKNGEKEYKNFKWFLSEYQMREGIDRTYVGLHYGNPSIREGKLKDVKFLLKKIDGALVEYEKYKKELREDDVIIGEEMEIPFGNKEKKDE